MQKNIDSTKMKKILILLSSYNGEKYLESQIESVLTQKGVEVNILIRDDGSLDSTKQILKKYSSKKIKSIYGENIGACKSFFELIKKASIDYDFYAFCDQDDVWLDNKIASAIDKLKLFDSSKPSLYYSGQFLTDSELNVKKEHVMDKKRSVKANWIFNQMAGCTAVFNKSLMKLLKEYIPNNVNYHDVWCYKLCACFDGNIYVDSNSYIYYRQHGNNVIGMNSGIKGKLDRAYKYIFKYNCSSFAKEIIKGYGDKISDEWMEFIKNIINSNNEKNIRKKILHDKEIVFNSFFLRAIFVFKVLMKKL